MNLSLKGIRAIVCGSTQGIGKAIALKLALQGAAITLIVRDKKKLIATQKKLNSINKNDHNFIVSDFNNLKLLKTRFNDYLKLNTKPTILINNTGGPPPGLISKASSNDFEKYAFSKIEILKKIKSNLNKLGAKYISLSGSGSCIYGIFKEKDISENDIGFDNYIVDIIG